MNKVITINLNGVAYQLEEGGYDALRVYLENAARRLEGNPDKDEIITDIEQAIADKFRARLGAHKTVVNTKEVTAVLDEMGPVQDDSTASAERGTASATRATGPDAGSGKEAEAGKEGSCPRRLFRIPEGAMLSGLCNGLAAYLNIDVTLIRLAFTLLTLLWGTGLLVYLVMAIIVPEARTPAEKSAASGAAATAQEFIKRAREGYYEGMKSLHDRHARREWKRKFKQAMRSSPLHFHMKYGFHQQGHEQSQQWQQGWAPPGAPLQSPIYGPVFIAPFLSILLFALVILTVYAIWALAATGAVFGLALPAGMPLWVGILLLVVAYQLLAWPIKSVRYACYYPPPHHDHGNLLGGLIGSLIGLFFFGFLIWMLDRRVPEFHQWLVELPGLLQRFGETVQAWFARKA
jgi:phage shock protein PspC (stress-responsive transcriptional regulator)